MIRSFIVSSIGFFLVLIGLIVAANAPLGARADVREFWNRPERLPGDHNLSLQNSDEFYKAHLTKRFLTAAVISLAGTGFVVVGVARLSGPGTGTKSQEE